jgi:signal transduction histidine kinase
VSEVRHRRPDRPAEQDADMTTPRILGPQQSAPYWWPDATLAAAVGLFGLVEALSGYGSHLPELVVAALTATAVGCFRLMPGLALGLVWAMCLFQLVVGVGPMLVELAVAVVAFGCARFGSTTVVWLSGLSIPAAAVVGGLWSLRLGFDSFRIFDSLRNGARVPVSTNQIVALAPGILVGLVLPWLVGLGLRQLAGSRSLRLAAEERQQRAEERQAEAEHERTQAEEIARLREGQAHLARDVHDVVGHSLAVILAQAESAQYFDDVDTGKMREVLSNVADSARRSLQDVRQVLTNTGTGQGMPVRSDGLDALVEGVRAAGNEVRVSVLGVPATLPPELDVVAYRVLQEMLTNALKHGLRGTPVLVEQAWADQWSADELRLEVTNEVPAEEGPAGDLTQPVRVAAEPESPAGSMGLDSMRQRLEAVGGRLDVRLRDRTFTATAWVPLRARELA